MCGRYALYELEQMGAHYGVELPGKINPNFNVAPTQVMPVITSHDGLYELEMMKWGIPRMIGKDLVKEIINTRADKAFGGFWRKTVSEHRCLVPSNGFYEWKKTSDGKQPFFIHPKDDPIFSFAGIWNSWTNKEGETFNAYSIMTTEPNNQMKAVHDRMPIILHKDEEEAWLDSSLDSLSGFFHPYEDDGLELFEVSKAVNSARTNDGTLIRPMNSA